MARKKPTTLTDASAAVRLAMRNAGIDTTDVLSAWSGKRGGLDIATTVVIRSAGDMDVAKGVLETLGAAKVKKIDTDAYDVEW